MAMLTHEYTYVYAAVSPGDGALDSLVLPHVNTVCMQVFINEVTARYPHQNVVMMLDGAGWHKSKTLRVRRICASSCCHPSHPSSTRRNKSWRNCANSSSTTASSIRSTRSKTISCSRCTALKRSTIFGAASALGLG